MSILKVVILEGTFPELPSSKMYATGRGTGSSLKVAAANAIRNLLKQPALKSRRITAAKIVMSVGTKDTAPSSMSTADEPCPDCGSGHHRSCVGEGY